jgi:UDP-2,4-diacetamido-2,4,6-trideoxy-beta-L-altropyranose hydrolase
MKNIAFRADASLHIGTGHVMRCLTLADSLRAEGHQCHFICREQPGHLVQKIQNLGFSVHTLPAVPSPATGVIPAPYDQWLGADWTTDAQQTSVLIQGLCLDWLITDHYALDRDWEHFIQRQHPRLNLMVIDDLANRHHHCHILLDQNLGRQASDYAPWVGTECKVFAGADYVMLRSEFTRLRPYSLARRATSQLHSILISMGGIDNDDATSLVLRTLQDTPMPSSTQITVVMGGGAPHIDSVKAIAAQMPYATRVVVNASNMAQLMADSDLAIGAAGSTSWERCHMGLPTLMVILAANQQPACQALEHQQAALSIGQFADIRQRLPDLMQSLFQQPQTLKYLSDHAAKLCNNAGYQQIIDQLLRSPNDY